MGGVVSRIDTVLRRMEAQEKGREEKGAIMDDFFDPGRRESDLVGVDLHIYILNHVWEIKVVLEVKQSRPISSIDEKIV